MNTEKVYNEVMDIFTISARIVKDTKAFAVAENNHREWRMSILSVAKVVQEQYNNVLCEEEYQKEIDDRKKNLLEL
jgi:hypothetical protein